MSNTRKACRCLRHEEWSGNAENVKMFNIKVSKAVKKVVVSYLQEKSFLTNKDSFLCSSCVTNVERKLKIHQTTTKHISLPTPPVFEPSSFLNICTLLVEQIETFKDEIIADDTVLSHLCSVSKSLGSLLNAKIFNHGSQLSLLYKDSDYLKTMNSFNFITSCNKILTSFLEGLIGVSLNSLRDPKLIYTFCIVLESIYHLRNRNHVFPHHFLCNLMQSSISGSKTVAAVNGKFSPSASYTSYHNWIPEVSTKTFAQIECDIDFFFDNLGKYLERSYRISTFKANSPTTITSTLFINLPPNHSFLQGEEKLKPVKWRFGKSELELQVIMEKEINRNLEKFAEYRIKYLHELILIYNEHKQSMDSKIETFTSEGDRRCQDCNKLFVDLKRKCDSCGGAVVKQLKQNSNSSFSFHHTEFDDLFSRMGNAFSINDSSSSSSSNPKAEVHMGKPIMVNPNSYVNIQVCLDTIKENLKIGERRKWVFLGCDGPPFCLMSRLIDCDPLKYDWAAPISGLGHLNMNQIKTFFNVCDKIILEPLGRNVLNFSSEKAYTYFVNCKDNHKSWQSFQVLLHGTIMELFHLFEISEDEPLSPSSFLSWQHEIANPTLRLMFELFLNFGLGIYIQRVGDRFNCRELSLAGRLKFDDLFYAFRHPIYQEVEYRELRSQSSYPEQVKILRDRNLSFASTVLHDKCQGGDFILEQKIRRQKMLCPKGPVEAKVWERVSGAVDEVDAILSNSRPLSDVLEKDRKRFINISEEVFSWRCYLRESGYFHNAKLFNVPISINGHVLTDDMINITLKC